jgi:cellulose synthase/poly-beta-1,6-N-acetylglucosamine synthase-like glycosyltransferase
VSLGIDPFVASLLFSVGLVPHASKVKAKAETPTLSPAVMPFVTVVVALYREKLVDIEMTLLSLLGQTYPREKYEVLIVVEADDANVRPHAETGVQMLRQAGISAKTVVSHGARRLKAYALNVAIQQARGEFCAFYDASDDIEESQIEKAVCLMQEKHYDAAQAIVLRKGHSFLSKLLLIDTVFWFAKYLPFLLSVARGIPLSGEGLFVRRSVLNEVGGFPEVLTEDAYLGLILTERNKRFGLVSSTVTEKAPKNIRAHFVQRLRWNRGYLTCLVRLLRSDLALKRKCVLLLPFLAPLSCALAFWGWAVIAVQGALSASAGVLDSSVLQQSTYSQVLDYWSTVLLCAGIPLCVLSYAHTLWAFGMRRYIPFLILLPYYWAFTGLAATCSFFKSTKHWGRTQR